LAKAPPVDTMPPRIKAAAATRKNLLEAAWFVFIFVS
jgi:hypothetical protein